MSEKVIRDSMSHSVGVSLDGTTAMPAAGLAQLAVSVVLLSSAWPLTKIALSLGSTPLWFAEGRSALSGLTIAYVGLLGGPFGTWCVVRGAGDGGVGAGGWSGRRA